jgi:hypothetical protein
MSWKLIFALSLFGLAMGIATVFAIKSDIEPYAWLGIFVVCAFVIAKRARGKHFLHGLCVGLVNGVWVTGAHLAFFNAYVAEHAREAAMAGQMAARLGSARVAMAITGPVIGLASGVVLGLLCYVVSLFIVSSHSDYAGW